MKNFLSMAALGVMLLMIAGCASSPATRFYVLSSIPEIPAKTDQSCVTIGVGPIEMPHYLMRTQIAATSSENEITYAEFDQWVQPLSSNFSHVVTENISKLICTRAAYQFPWSGQELPDYRIRIEVIAMTGNPGAKAFMDAWWTVTDKDKKVVASTRSRYTEPVQGSDYRALVQAYSRIMATLSRDIAKVVPVR